MTELKHCIKIIGVLLVLVASGCVHHVEVPLAKVQQKVEKKFPVEKSVVVAKAKFYKPKVYFEGSEVGIRLKFRASFLNRKVKGKVDVRGVIAYDPEKKRFYVDEIYIVDVDTGKVKLSDLGQMKDLVSRLVAKRINGLVVYTLDDSKRKERYAASRIEKVEVDESGEVLIITLGRKRR
ncbi:MAG: DUF1439 domain-containing protein [Deltaproteobacteria bacterium]|nr:DUF1439 domain-containing protein [Deltaproteobacteria bacterium]MBN2670979.1 DUF1439 domain-containing protein [Deltaproteobacteria bacterium]